MWRYSVQPWDQMFVRDCGFLSFTRNMGKILVKVYVKT